jgi:hypothetical protein
VNFLKSTDNNDTKDKTYEINSIISVVVSFTYRNEETTNFALEQPKYIQVS